MTPTPEFQVHQYCSLFPLMDDAALASLATDIRENGLREPITLFRGQIIDGRNRLRACQIASVAPAFVEYAGTAEDLLTWIASHNLHRRHLSPSQQALVAAQVVQLLKAESRRFVTRDAAAALGMTQRQVQYAAKVIERAVPELVGLVRDGGVSIQIADKVATLPPARQRKVVKAGPAAVLREYHRLDGKIWRPGEVPAAKARRRQWDRVFTSFGVALRSCDLGQIETEIRRRPMIEDLLRAIAGRMGPAGTVDSHLTAEEFDRLLRDARA